MYKLILWSNDILLCVCRAGDADGLCYRLARACPKPNPMLVDMSRGMKDKWEVPRHEIKLLTEIGKGNFGTVHKGASWSCYDQNNCHREQCERHS